MPTVTVVSYEGKLTHYSILSCDIKGILEGAFVCEVTDCFFLDIFIYYYFISSFMVAGCALVSKLTSYQTLNISHLRLLLKYHDFGGIIDV